MKATAGWFRALVGTFDAGDRSITFAERPIIGWLGRDGIVGDGDALVTTSWLDDGEASDSIVEILAPGEVPTLEQRVDMSNDLFLRMMRFNLL